MGRAGNRAGLALTGAVLFAAGGAVAAGGVGAFGRSWARRGVLGSDVSGFVARNAWFWPVVAAAASALALAGVLWLLAQGRTDTVRRLALGRWDHGQTRLPARAATAAFVSDLQGRPGVRRVQARIAGTPDRPRLVATITCDDDTDLRVLRSWVEGAAVERLRAALELSTMHVVLRYRPARLPG